MRTKNKKHIAMLTKIVKDLEAYKKQFPRNYYQHSIAHGALEDLKDLLSQEKDGWED